jgi:hypothetical protein
VSTLPGTTATVTIADKSFPVVVTSAASSGYSVDVKAATGWIGTFFWSKSAGAYKAGSLYTLSLN